MVRKKLLIGGIVLAGAVGGLAFFFAQKAEKPAPVVLQNETPAVSEKKESGKEAGAEEQAPLTPQKQDAPTGSPAPTKKVGGIDIRKNLVNFGFQTAEGRKIDTIIIHSTYNALGGDPFSVDKILNIYKSYGVSPHYLIDRQGTILQMVEDKNIAYHAGVAKLPDGRTNVNEVSLGIEMINTKTDKFTPEQYQALNKLLALLESKYKIKYVLGHNQIAPGRKDDPWNLDWSLIKK